MGVKKSDCLTDQDICDFMEQGCTIPEIVSVFGLSQKRIDTFRNHVPTTYINGTEVLTRFM
jgi:hypothetical protein